MAFLSPILKPEYLFRPGQLLRRLARRGARPEFAEITTPWGLPMRVRPREAIGHSLWHLGVLDLPVTEVIWRLAEPGETLVDVGANIGYVTGLMATRAGTRGEVWAFEPCPEIHEELAAHVTRWRTSGRSLANLHLHAVALSDHAGTACLFQPSEFATNRGTASLEAGPANAAPALGVSVALNAYDAVIPGKTRVDVLKIDVEGHELSVFKGASRALGEGRVRDIVFEEHRGYPSATSSFLESFGYTIWRIDRAFLGPLLLPPDSAAPNSDWLPPNFLASRHPDRARRLCSPRGWRVL